MAVKGQEKNRKELKLNRKEILEVITFRALLGAGDHYMKGGWGPSLNFWQFSPHPPPSTGCYGFLRGQGGVALNSVTPPTLPTGCYGFLRGLGGGVVNA